MFAALLAKIGLDVASKTSGRLLVLIIIAGALLLSATVFWRGMVAIENMVSEARRSERAERDAHWKGEIATSNAAAERARADQAIAAARASAEAETKISDLTKSLTEWEARNAATPDRACLDAGDIDDLNRLRRPGAARPGAANRAR